MRFVISSAALALVMTCLSAQTLASDKRHGRQEESPRVRMTTFNVFCKYKPTDEGGRYKKCYAGAWFWKDVSKSGREIEDNSEYPLNPVFEVECDGDTVFNENGRRFTDREGTRIQAETGPYPAIILPRGALAEGRRAVPSYLELRTQTLKGSCQIYTGEP